MKKVIIAIDSFKGSLTSLEAAQAAAKGVRAFYPLAEVLTVPIADGGEGTLQAIHACGCGQWIATTAPDPLMRPIRTAYLGDRSGSAAYIEMAAVNGLPLVPPPLRHPLITSTYGTGKLIADALDQGFRHLFIGIGGSATSDGGTGMLQALGFRFYTAEGKLLPSSPQKGMSGQHLCHIDRIDSGHIHPALKEASLTVACDVNNPLYGPKGAAYVFAPQKGASPSDVKLLDQGLRHWAEVTLRTNDTDMQQIAGAGAAGGLGGAFAAYLHATLVPGIEWLLQAVHFDHLLADADLVITGEGKADRQTLMGKVPYGILQAAKKRLVPVALFAGQTEDQPLLLQAGFHSVHSITPSTQPLAEALKPEIARQNLTDAILHFLKAGPFDSL